MTIFGKCCCCNLKSGNIVLASLWLIGALFGLGMSADRINDINTIPRNVREKKPDDYWFSLLSSDSDMLKEEGINITICVLTFLASICLIVGAIKANRQLILVFLIVDGITTVLYIIQHIIHFVTTGFNYIYLFICIISVGINIFFLLFPLSLYQEVRDLAKYPAASGQVHYPAASGQVHYPAATGQVYYPATTGQVHYPAATGQVHYPAGNDQIYYPEATGQFHYPTASGQVHYPAQTQSDVPYKKI